MVLGTLSTLANHIVWPRFKRWRKVLLIVEVLDVGVDAVVGGHVCVLEVKLCPNCVDVKVLLFVLCSCG